MLQFSVETMATVTRADHLILVGMQPGMTSFAGRNVRNQNVTGILGHRCCVAISADRIFVLRMGEL